MRVELRQEVWPCETAGRMLRDVRLKSNTKEDIDLNNCNEILDHIYSEAISKIRMAEPPAENGQQAFMHLELMRLTNHKELVLTREEFEALMVLYPEIDMGYKNEIWQHNTQCIVGFSNRLTWLTQKIKALAERNRAAVYGSEEVTELQDKLRRFQEVIRQFLFCKTCLHYNEGECLMWEMIIIGFGLMMARNLSVSNEHQLTQMIDKYEQLCKCFLSGKSIKGSGDK